MDWRTITAEQYRQGADPEGGFDEAYIVDHSTGDRREVWDVGTALSANAKVLIYTAQREPMHVDQSHPIEVR